MAMNSMLIHYLKCYLCKKLYWPKNQKIHKNVIVSMTTTPQRIAYMWPTLNSILLQTELPEKIYLWLPKEYKRFGTTITKLPSFLYNHPLIEVNFIEKDYGPASKLFPALLKFSKDNKKIIIFDDDRIYHPLCILLLIKFSILFPNCAITLNASNITNKKRYYFEKTKRVKAVDIFHGCGGVLIKPNFFLQAVFNYPTDLESAFFEDDVWFSGWLKTYGIKIIMAPHAFATDKQSIFVPYSFVGVRFDGKNALWLNENRKNVNFFRTWEYFENKHK